MMFELSKGDLKGLVQEHKSRRGFIKLGATAFATVVGGSLVSTGYAATDPAPEAEGSGTEASGESSHGGAGSSQVAHGAEALLLNCMDYRLADDITSFMNERTMTNRYDQIVLAGATLGVATDKFPAWSETFWKHLELAIELHHVSRVIAVDHRDCGAFKLAFGQDLAANPAVETEIHTRVMREFRQAVKERHPSLEVDMFLMSLDGRAESIA
jgi:hypothetical protein